ALDRIRLGAQVGERGGGEGGVDLALLGRNAVLLRHRQHAVGEVDLPQRDRAGGTRRDQGGTAHRVNDREAVVEVVQCVGAEVDVLVDARVDAFEPGVEPAG